MAQEDWKYDGHREDHTGGGVKDYSQAEVFTGKGARCDSENVPSSDTKGSFCRNSKINRNEENKSRGRHGSPEWRNWMLIMHKICGKYIEISHKCVVQGFMIVGWWHGNLWPLTTRVELPGVCLSLKYRQKVFQIHWSTLFLCNLLSLPKVELRICIYNRNK